MWTWKVFFFRVYPLPTKSRDLIYFFGPDLCFHINLNYGRLARKVAG